MNCSVRTVQRYLRIAIDEGYVEVKRRYLRSNLYRLKCLVERVATPSCRIEHPIQENTTFERVEFQDSGNTDLLKEFRAVMGKHVFKRNLGWFRRLIRTIASDTLANGLAYVKSALRDSESSHEKIKSPSALLTWFLRNVGALPPKTENAVTPPSPAPPPEPTYQPKPYVYQPPPPDIMDREELAKLLREFRANNPRFAVYAE